MRQSMGLKHDLWQVRLNCYICQDNSGGGVLAGQGTTMWIFVWIIKGFQSGKSVLGLF